MNSHRIPLSLHAFVVALSIFLLVGLRCWKFPVALAFALTMGVGDGKPSVDVQILGGIIFALMAAAVIFIFIFFLTFLRRAIGDATCHWSQKTILIIGVICVSAWSLFMAWKAGAVNRIDRAILSDNVGAYEKAVKWRDRKDGDVDSDLFFAARMGRLRMVEYLISEGANPNSKLGGGGDSVLSGSIANVLNRPDGNKPVVEYLKSHGATN